MIIELSQEASNAMLDVLAGMMDGGSIELLTSDGRILAALKLGNPVAQEAFGGELEFNKVAERDAVLTGQAQSARIVAANGSEVFSCDVGDENSDAVIKLNPAQITRGAPVQLRSFRLMMP